MSNTVFLRLPIYGSPPVTCSADYHGAMFLDSGGSGSGGSSSVCLCRSQGGFYQWTRQDDFGHCQ